MSRRKISQTDAWMYFHKSQRLERILQEQKNRWRTEWQEGWVNIETLILTDTPFAKLATARLLGHALIILPDHDNSNNRVRVYAE